MNLSVLPPKPDLVNLSMIAHRPDYGNGMVGTLTAKQIIDAIHHSVTRNQRLHALQTALHAFSHTTTDLHNYELDLGAANACCLKLGYAMLQYHQRRSYEIAQEVDMLCSCLRHLYGGCSTERLAISYRDLGQPELIPLLVQVIFQIHVENDDPCMSHAAWRALQLLRVFSKLDPAKEFIVHFPGILSQLARMIVLSEKGSGIISETVGLIKNLCFRSTDEIKQTIFGAPGLLKALMGIADRRDGNAVEHGADGRRHNSCDHVTAIVWNLAMTESIAKTMVLDEDLLASFSRWLVHEDTTLKTKRNALSALGNLARCCGSSRRLDHFLSLLPSIVRQEEDVDCRRRAMRTIRHLLAEGCTWDGDDMLPFLLSVVDQEPDRDTKIQALETMRHLTGCSQLVTSIGSSLAKIVEQSMDAKVTLTACSTLQALVESDHLVDLMSESFLGSLDRSLKRSQDTQEEDSIVCDLVVRLLETMSETSSNKLTSSKAGMDLIATILSQAGNQRTRDSKSRCLKILQHAASHEQPQLKPMADHELLLSSIVNYALEEEGQAKESAKKLIVALVAEL